MKKFFNVSITLTVEAISEEEAIGIGYGAAEHLLDTFNDNKSISPLVQVEAEEISP